MTDTSGDVYIVKPGDTLTSIARSTGKTVADLIRWNGIKDKNRLEIGQTLYLSADKAFAWQVLFLDALRYPIENLKYRLAFDGRVIPGISGSNGLTPEFVTKWASSMIEVYVQDSYGYWQKVGAALSGYGKKLITLVSPSIVFDGRLEPHPPGAPIAPVPDKASKPSPPAVQPPLPPAPPGNPSKNNPSVKPHKTKGKHGESVMEIGIDLPLDLLAYMQAYDGKPISDDDWAKSAAFLECEVNVLKAIAAVESGGRTAFWVINDTARHRAHAPKILFERHQFHRLTHGQYDNTHPDISSRYPYVRRKDHPLGSAYKNLPDGHVDRDDLYDNQQDYLRLINAYRLDKEAALMSASWGKFQIMGVNHEICGERTIKTFVQKMCKNEAGQIELLAGFIRHKPQAWKDVKKKALGKEISLWEAVKIKNWQAIAFNYNGPRYKKYEYDRLLKEAYEAYCSKPV